MLCLNEYLKKYESNIMMKTYKAQQWILFFFFKLYCVMFYIIFRFILSSLSIYFFFDKGVSSGSSA